MDKLSERKRKILKFVVEEYILKAEPVGSRTISKNEELSISAATVRNEMSDLEEMGYLLKPHVSSGRVPSKKAYLIYVDEMMKDIVIDKKEKEIIKSTIETNVDRINSLLTETADLISNLTNYTAIAILKNSNKKKDLVKHFELLKLSKNRLLMLIVMEDGKVLSKDIYFEKDITEEKIDIISKTIRSEIIGKNIRKLDEEFERYIKSQIVQYDKLLDEMISTINRNLSKGDNFSIILKGANNIFNYPEFNDIERVKSFLTFIEDENVLLELVKNEGVIKDKVNIVIGDENMENILGNCSMVTSNFITKNNNIGKFGIIGPKRMDYQKAYSLMRYINQCIDDIF